jgi:hypothetical protein
MLHADPESDPARDRIPRGTTPTWEMELLLSGATVFGLLPLPAQADRLFYLLFDRTGSETVAPLLLAAWLYAKFALTTITVTFVVHLALRAYWIALVGLDSVYPGGIRWERLRLGPLHRAVIEPGAPAMEVRIEAADNRATRVFGVGVGLAMFVLPPLVVAVICIGASLALEAAGVHTSANAVLALAGLFFGPLLLASVLDRHLGRRVDPAGLAGRDLATVLRAYDRVGVGRGMNALISIFQSNAGAWRTVAVILVAFAAATALVLGQVAAQAGWDPGSYPGLPDEDDALGDAVPAESYATTRAAEPTMNPQPFIQDRVVKGSYLELFVPYRPRRHAPALRAACPDAVAVADRGGSARPALDCLAGLLDVRIDGAPQPVRLDASSDPATGKRGVLAVIPVGSLAAGRHELTLRRIARPGREPQSPHRIPFWR